MKRLAGAGGFEPPYAGIKIRCLTTWLRPTIATDGSGGVEREISAVAGGGTLSATPRRGNNCGGSGGLRGGRGRLLWFGLGRGDDVACVGDELQGFVGPGVMLADALATTGERGFGVLQ